MLDKLPAAVRHALIALLATLLAWGADALPNLSLPPIATAVLTPLLAILIAWITPLTHQYGIGSGEVSTTGGED
jgi:hypothetical protein